MYLKWMYVLLSFSYVNVLVYLFEAYVSLQISINLIVKNTGFRLKLKIESEVKLDFRQLI